MKRKMRFNWEKFDQVSPIILVVISVLQVIIYVVLAVLIWIRDTA